MIFTYLVQTLFSHNLILNLAEIDNLDNNNIGAAFSTRDFVI